MLKLRLVSPFILLMYSKYEPKASPSQIARYSMYWAILPPNIYFTRVGISSLTSYSFGMKLESKVPSIKDPSLYSCVLAKLGILFYGETSKQNYIPW